jgi:S-(hydroxymethyl)glutathione dehydrogenase/alcohol dehydrogenase
VRPGETVAVLGCGGIGLNAIQAASLVGAARVIAIDRLPWKLEMARTFGATDVVDASSADPVAAVQELTAGGVDHAFEAIGLKTTAEQAFSMLGKGGTATVIGMVPVGQRLEIDATQLLGGKRLQGSNMGSNRFRIDMPQYVDWYLSGAAQTRRARQRHDAPRPDQPRFRGPGGRHRRPSAHPLRLNGPESDATGTASGGTTPGSD